MDSISQRYFPLVHIAVVFAIITETHAVERVTAPTPVNLPSTPAAAPKPSLEDPQPNDLDYERLAPFFHAARIEVRVCREPLTHDSYGEVPMARITPQFRQGVAFGFKVSSIPRGSSYEDLGFHDGDIVRNINGFDLASPEKSLRIYSTLKNASHFDVFLERDGHPIQLCIDLLECSARQGAAAEAAICSDPSTHQSPWPVVTPNDTSPQHPTLAAVERLSRILRAQSPNPPAIDDERPWHVAMPASDWREIAFAKPYHSHPGAQ